jgi:tetratricopeptide (TPR) repeat protein
MSMIKIPECYSLFGEVLYPKPIGLWLPTDPAELESKLQELRGDREKAIQDCLSAPNDAAKLLWYARKTEILGNFNEAVAAYTKGIKRWPDDPRFPRFRGHRFALLRRLDLAIMDLTKASRLIEDQPDEAELYASGGPSKDKMGFSSFHWNVWYHLGFSHFAAGNHTESVEAYQRCFEYCDTKESLVATSHWIYMPLIRLGRLSEASKLLNDIQPGLDFVEVGDYYETLLMYKGHSSPTSLLESARRDVARFSVKGQAVANLHLSRGDVEKAVDVYREVLATGMWTGGVYLIAEAELKRLGFPPRRLEALRL